MPDYWQCNTCNGAMLAGSKYCPQCGADMAKPPLKPGAAKPPPKDEYQLPRWLDVALRVPYWGCLTLIIAGLAIGGFSAAYRATHPDTGETVRARVCGVCGGTGKLPTQYDPYRRCPYCTGGLVYLD